jgi:hypothetical protein
MILLLNGEKIPASTLRHSLILEMLDNGILKKQIRGRSKASIYLRQPKPMTDYLHNHYGDFDFEGIAIYLHEYKKHLGNKAGFFIPDNIEILISNYGNKKLYDRQRILFNARVVKEEKIVRLIKMIHKYKKGLEQEIMLNF